jgi:uroporphyrinogen decarboxylase
MCGGANAFIISEEVSLMSVNNGQQKSNEPRNRRADTLKKLDRVNKALRHEEPDRVPVSDFFWGSFIQRWRRELGLPDNADPRYYYDLDYVVTLPNMDPWIRPFEMLRETPSEVIVKTGFGAILHKRFALPMPEMRGWETDSFEKLERVEFDDPRDRRRFYERGDNQVAGVVTDSSAIPRPGSTPSRCSARISRSLAA